MLKDGTADIGEKYLKAIAECASDYADKIMRKLREYGLIKCVNVGGEMAPKADIRPIEYEWVKNLYLEAKERNIEFYFHQCGSMFLKDGVNIGKWNLKRTNCVR